MYSVLILSDDPTKRSKYREILEGGDFRPTSLTESRNNIAVLQSELADHVDCVLIEGLAADQCDSLQAWLDSATAGLVILTDRRNQSLLSGFARAPTVEIIDQSTLSSEKLHWSISFAVERARTSRSMRRHAANREALIKVLSHDFREPIATIRGLSRMINSMSDTQGSEDEIPDLCERLDRCTDRMDELVFVLRTFHVISDTSNRGDQFALDDVIVDVEKRIQLPAWRQRPQIRFSGLPSLFGNRSLAALLFQNLIHNSVKFNESTIPMIDIAAEGAGRDWLICVEDNGIGIEEKYHGAIFEPAVRLHAADEYPGVGFGLAICRAIVECFGGRIWCTHGISSGTAIRFTIPKTCAVTKNLYG